MILPTRAILLLLSSLSAAVAQTATGSIQGFANNDSGKPIAGAYAVAIGIGTTSHASHTAVISSAGEFTFPNLEPGQYQVCIQQPGGQHLDPCQWGRPQLITVTSGKVAANQVVTAVKGTSLQVRVNDPKKILGSDSPSDLIVSVVLPNALVHPMHLASNDGAGRTYDIAIPGNTPVRVLVHSSRIQLTDEAGLSLAPPTAVSIAPSSSSLASSSGFTVQVPANAATHQVTLTVTGKK